MRDRDAAMDAYAFVLQALRDNGCRRLRAYVPNATSRFETWLLVVARRLALDYYRHRYGRPRSQDESRRVDQLGRRSLEDLVGEEIDADEIEDTSARSPDAGVRADDLRRLLQRSIDELHPADRLLLVLRFVDECPVREIARALDLPTVFHVYRRLAAVLSALRGALARRGVVGPDA